jgi:hypothetical protein
VERNELPAERVDELEVPAAVGDRLGGQSSLVEEPREQSAPSTGSSSWGRRSKLAA